MGPQDFQKYMKDRGVDVSKDRPRKALASGKADIMFLLVKLKCIRLILKQIAAIAWNRCLRFAKIPMLALVQSKSTDDLSQPSMYSSNI